MRRKRRIRNRSEVPFSSYNVSSAVTIVTGDRTGQMGKEGYPTRKKVRTKEGFFDSLKGVKALSDQFLLLPKVIERHQRRTIHSLIRFCVVSVIALLLRGSRDFSIYHHSSNVRFSILLRFHLGSASRKNFNYLRRHI